jgi:hypothetical protein
MVWSIMRVREDKSLPNAQHVAERVMRSIRDGIRQEELLELVHTQAYRPPPTDVAAAAVAAPQPPQPPT